MVSNSNFDLVLLGRIEAGAKTQAVDFSSVAA